MAVAVPTRKGGAISNSVRMRSGFHEAVELTLDSKRGGRTSVLFRPCFWWLVGSACIGGDIGCFYHCCQGNDVDFNSERDAY